MISSESLNELAPALAAAQAEFKGVAMSGQNTFDKYKYAKLGDYINTTHPILVKHGLTILTSVEDVASLEPRSTKSGGSEFPVRVKIVQRIMHKSGQWLETVAWGDGQDRGDKGVYKAVTGARKYGLASALNLATTDDPEGDARARRRADPVGMLTAAFEKIGVEADELAELAGCALEDLGEKDLDRLRGIYKQMVEGKAGLEGIAVAAPPADSKATVASSPQPRRK